METFVVDGHADFYGLNEFKISSPAKYNRLIVADSSEEKQFKVDLKAHQQGKTDFLIFCKDASKSGVAKWTVCMDEMTCTCFDKLENKVLIEKIPQ